jgi:tetratricopeptide (TPR) repeat protein
VGIVAGILCALYWPLIYFEGDLLMESMAVFLDVLALLVLAAALRKGRSWLFVWAGFVFGVSAIARPSILAFVPCIPVALVFASRVRGAAPTPWLRQSILVALGLVVVIAPVIVRNYVVGRDVVPIASQGGVNFYIGNNPQANGSRAWVPGLRADLQGTYQGAVELAEKEVGRTLKPSEASNYYFKKGLDFILTSPGQATSLMLKKLYLFWAGVERSNDKYMQFFWRKFGLGVLPLPGFWLVGPLGLLGGVLLWKRRSELAVPYLFVVSYMIGVVLFFVNGRFRLPVAPVLMVFAAYALCYLYSGFRAKSKDFGKALLVLGVCVFIVDIDYLTFRGVRAVDEAVSHYTLGNAYMKMDRKREALSSYEAVHALRLRYPSPGYAQIAGGVDYQLGMLYKENGFSSRSIEAFSRIHRRDPSAVPAARELGSLHESARRFPEAIQAYRLVLATEPRDAFSLVGLARTYRKAGDRAKSDETLARLRQLYPNDAAVQAEIEEIEKLP